MGQDFDLCQADFWMKTSDQKHPAMDFQRCCYCSATSDAIITHTNVKNKKNKRLVTFLCAFLEDKKNLFILLIPSRPTPPVSGCIFCYVRHRLLNKPSQWKSSSSGNHRGGCTSSWQEERDNQQKNKQRRWRAARFSCLNQQIYRERERARECLCD